jgi:hypothetical protein
MDARLLNTQKTDVFTVIKQGGLDPLLFSFEDGRATIDKSPVSVLRFKTERPYYFKFDFYHGNFTAQCSPWQDRRETRFEIGRWSAVPQHVGRWIDCLQSELNTPDPWKALPGYANVADLRIAPDVANTQFTFIETERVTEALNDIRQLVLKHVQGSREQGELIDRELKSLADSSKRMGRKDWFNLVIGALINLAMAIALPADVTRQMFEILRDALSGVVHFLPPIIATGQQLIG